MLLMSSGHNLFGLSGTHTARRTAQQSSSSLRSMVAARRSTAPCCAARRCTAPCGAARRWIIMFVNVHNESSNAPYGAARRRFCCSNRFRFDFAVWCRAARQCECRTYFTRVRLLRIRAVRRGAVRRSTVSMSAFVALVLCQYVCLRAVPYGAQCECPVRLLHIEMNTYVYSPLR